MINMYVVKHAVRTAGRVAKAAMPYVVQVAGMITTIAQLKEMQQTNIRNQYVDYKMKQENYHPGKGKRP